jgi:hypothetical protein
MKQNKFQSFIESCIQVSIGFIIAYCIQLMVFPFYDIEVTYYENFQITIIFTLASLSRSYIIRRCFNRIK